MSYAKVSGVELEVGPGPDPAASPFDRCIGAALGLSAFFL